MTKTTCRVAEIAAELAELSAIRDVTEEKSLEATKTGEPCWDWNRAGSYAWDRHHDLRSVAATYQATSPDGALMQVMLIVENAERLAATFEALGELLDDRPASLAEKMRAERLDSEKALTLRRIQSCAYSVRRWIESAHETAATTRAVVEGGMCSGLDPFRLVDRARGFVPRDEGALDAA